MGICTCGKKTVWNDMCSDCNDEFEDRIYSDEEKVTLVPRQSSFFSSEVLNLHIYLKSISGASGLDHSHNFIIYHHNGVNVEIITKGPSFTSIVEEHQRLVDALKSVYE